jgi:hypothetical protein
MKYDQFEPWEPNTYRTGSTTPPKAHSRLVAILLVLVVFLAGLVSILSLLNIRLFSTFYESQLQKEVPLSLEIGHYPEDDLIPGEPEPVSASGNKSIGIQGDTVTPVYQKHFKLPEGLFITYVDEQSTAHRQGVQEGDVLISLEGVPITGEDSLEAFLEAHAPGEECTALVYRRDTDEQLRVTLTIEQIEP